MRATLACALLAAGMAGCALESSSPNIEPEGLGCAGETHTSPLVDLGCHANTTLLGWIQTIIPPLPFGPYVLGGVGICYRLDATNNQVAAQFVARTSPKDGKRSGFVLRLLSGGAVLAEGQDIHTGGQTYAQLTFMVPRGEALDVVLTVQASGGACSTEVGYEFSEATP
jgi:hypothetical protein